MKVKRTAISKWLSSHGYESITPQEFYRAMFPADELVKRNDKPRSAEANVEWKYNGILLENTHKVKDVMRYDEKAGVKRKTEKEIWKNYIVLDDLERINTAVSQFGKTNSEFYIAPISYLGRRRTKITERWLYACIIEVDHPKTSIVNGHREQTGLLQLIHDWTSSSMPYIMPSCCVSSGTGLHLIYLLDRPYQITEEHQKHQWDEFRVRFTQRIWNKYVTNSAIQYENHCQSFRVVGTRTKKNQLVEAFWLSKKRYTIDELFSQVKYDEITWNSFDEFIKLRDKLGDKINHLLYEPDDIMKIEKVYMPKGDKQISAKLQEAKEKWPEWYEERIIQKKPRKEKGEWTCHRGLYDWFLREAKESPFVGSRYNRIHALGEYAVKCDIDYDEYKKDAYELYMLFKDIDQKEPFHYMEFVKARDEYFNKKSRKSTRKWIEEKTGVPMNPPAKRNNRKRHEHLQADKVKNEKGRMVTNLCKLHREDVLEDMRMNGEITGRPDKKSIVKKWREENPNGKKIDCERETGLSRHTVLKWWDETIC